MPEVRVKPALTLTEKINGEIKLRGETVGMILSEFVRKFRPELEELGALVGERGSKLHPSIIVLLNGRNIRFLKGENTKVREGDLIMILPPTGGG